MLVMLSKPENEVGEVGAKRTLTPQFFPGRIAAPQLWLAMVNVAEPLMTSEAMLRLLVPVFVMLRDFVELPPTPMLVKDSDVGETLREA